MRMGVAGCQLAAHAAPDASLHGRRHAHIWVLQQDNDPCHNAASSIIQAWNQKHPGVHVTLLQGWPGSSPDLNCIENLWAWAEAKVNAMGCKDVEDFKKSVIETLQNVPQQLLQGLWGSMGKRIKACIALEGDKTKY